jgi:ATP-dependent Clp endopeptidase proteolytic subunit ClpP
MNEGHIFIDGEIDSAMYDYVRGQIAQVTKSGATSLIVHLTSPGGSVNYGYNIYHKIKNLSIPKECIIEGNCMSIATFIALSCDKITALNPSRYMVHLPALGIKGTREDLMNGAKELEQIESEMIAAYSTKTGLSEEKLREMLTKESYMSAEEAKSYGFVDEVKQQSKAVAHAKMSKEYKGLFNSLREQFDKVAATMFGQEAKALAMQSDKGVLNIQAESGEALEGKAVTINGEPAPDGEYKLEDGKTVTVAGGMIASIKDSAPQQPAQESPEDKMKKLESENAAMKAELDALKQAKASADEAQQKLATAEKELATINATAKESREAFMRLREEFEALEKKTVGSDAPPAGAAMAEKKPAGGGAATTETELFLREYMPHLLDPNFKPVNKN